MNYNNDKMTMREVKKRNRYQKKLRTLGNIIWSLLRGFLIIGISFIIIYPLIIKISTSFMNEADIYDLAVRWISRSPDFYNYRAAFIALDFSRALINSLLLCIIVGFLQLVSCTLVGYGLGRFKFKGDSILFGLVILTLIVPPQIVMVPLFLNFRFFDLFGLLQQQINLLGSYWPFVFTAITATGFNNGLFIYIMRQFFKGMPKELEEAAYVDGAGPFRTFFKVMLPGALPAMVIVFLFSFVWQWNDIFYTSMFLRGESFLSINLVNIEGRYRALHTSWFGGLEPTIQYTSLIANAGMVMFILPLIILYISMQKYFIESVQRTGIVG
ncbi:MAG: carbohydrate ABC transporter permease [Bacillota bacterium]